MTELSGSKDSVSKEEKSNFWKDVLGSPKYVVAPMVDASELAWRLLSRRHGAQLCYTPMLHSSVFCRDSKYRKDALASTVEDRPLIVQFCGNDPKILLEAALLAEPYCDAIDINIGCPQAIAKRGHYGSYLQDDWELLEKIVSTLSKSLHIPVTCKLRVFPEMSKTIAYAQMLEKSGASILTVHGRTREQKGPLTGLASWAHIRAVRENVKIPVFANGNIQCVQDIEKCIDETGVQGVMSAEGNLYNPFLFEGCYPPSWEPASEYLNLVEQHPAPSSYIRGHLFKMFQHIGLKVDSNLCTLSSYTFKLLCTQNEIHTTYTQLESSLCLAENEEARALLAENSTMESFRRVVELVKKRYLPYHEGRLSWPQERIDYDLVLPPWLCQPYVRDSPEVHHNKVEAKKMELKNGEKREFKNEEGNTISRKRMKKLRRITRRPNNNSPPHKRSKLLCDDCPNPLGFKCAYQLCRQCCRSKCFKDNLDCVGHRNLTKTRRKMAIDFAKERENSQNLM